jgi:uncharacterized OsmC-like protein/pimeloyl-ACP methyl ester carboxylesterase
MSNSVRDLSFESNGQTLQGHLHTPVGERPRAYALFAHCFTCTANSRAAVHIARALAAEGIAVLRFDFTGLGASDGDFADSNFSSNVDDLVAAATFLADYDRAPALLIGHSLGGTAALAAAAKLDSVKAVATLGAPAQPAHIEALLGEERLTIQREGGATVNLGGRPFKIKSQFLDDLAAQHLPASLRELRRPLLIMHAPLDDIVSIDNASELFSHALHPKSFVSLDNADHLLSREEDARYAAQVLAAWAGRYVPLGKDEQVLAGGPGRSIARTPREGYTTEVNAGGHPLIADEPVEAGGANLGPSPYDLLSGALAVCTAMTLQMYARRKELDLDDVTVEVRHRKIHAADCDSCETQTGRIDQFERIIDLEGDLTDAQRVRLLEIADRCPVHRTLESEVEVRTRAGAL